MFSVRKLPAIVASLFVFSAMIGCGDKAIKDPKIADPNVPKLEPVKASGGGGGPGKAGAGSQ